MDADTRPHKRARVPVTPVQSDQRATAATAFIDHTPDPVVPDAKSAAVSTCIDGPVAPHPKATVATTCIDHTAYPHIVGMIFDNADSVTRWVLSQTSRSLRERFHVDIGGHIGVFYRNGLVAIRPYRGVPTIPNLDDDDTNGKHPSTSGATEGSLDASETSPRERRSTPLHTCDDFGVPYEDWNNLTRAEVDWFATANITVVDVDDCPDTLARISLYSIRNLVNLKILRCPTLYHDPWHFKRPTPNPMPYSVVHPIRMLRWGSPNIALAAPSPSVDVNRTIFALHYDGIPATRYPSRPVNDRSHLVDVTIHISTAGNVDCDAYANASANDKRRNLDFFRNFLHKVSQWVQGDVTIVGLERVAGSLFGQTTPSVVQHLRECDPVAKSQRVTTSSAGNDTDNRLKWLTETEYVKLHDMSPLMLAIERGVGYRWPRTYDA